MELGSDIYLVGLGVLGLKQLTAESERILRGVSTVFHTTGKHDLLTAINNNVVDLSDMYQAYGPRIDVYQEIAHRVVRAASREKAIAYAFDGNPMFFSDVAWKLCAHGQKQGFRVEALPAVSCLDVLPLQLGFDPADIGFQVFEASQLVLYQLVLNPYLSTLILQIGYFGELSTHFPTQRPAGDFSPLVDHLSQFYPPDHKVVFIESGYMETSQTKAFHIELAQIDQVRNDLQPGMTLYVPRIAIPNVCQGTQMKYSIFE